LPSLEDAGGGVLVVVCDVAVLEALVLLGVFEVVELELELELELERREVVVVPGSGEANMVMTSRSVKHRYMDFTVAPGQRYVIHSPIDWVIQHPVCGPTLSQAPFLKAW